MAAIALVGLVPAVADLVAAALRSEGHAVVRRPLDADVVRDLGRAPPDVLVLDGHAYANTRALLTDLRAQAATRALPVVVLGPGAPRRGAATSRWCSAWGAPSPWRSCWGPCAGPPGRRTRPRATRSGTRASGQQRVNEFCKETRYGVCLLPERSKLAGPLLHESLEVRAGAGKPARACALAGEPAAGA